MVALHGPNSASTLLQQLAARTTPSPSAKDSVFSSAPTLKTAFLEDASFERLAGSKIFNALNSLFEKQTDSGKAVLKHIDGQIAELDAQARTFSSMASDAMQSEGSSMSSAVDATQTAKEALQTMKQYVLDHPELVPEMLDKIRTGRPELTKEEAITLLLQKLGEKMDGKASAEA